MDFEPIYPGFESRIFLCFFFFFFFLSLLLQCKFANSTLLSLLRFSYFITPYDAQAFSAFSALIKWWLISWLFSLGDSISVNMGSSPRDREKEERKEKMRVKGGRREK